MDIRLGNYTIHKYKVDDWNVVKAKLLEIYDKSSKGLYGNVITNWNESEKCRDFLKKAVDILSPQIKLFKSEFNVEHNVIDLWFQEYERGMDHGIHDHGLYGYSSVLYVEYDPRVHKSTTFVNMKTKESFCPDVEEGDIIFFKSKYKHCSPPNKSDRRRIVCAFNLKPDRFDNFSY